jgi:RimJ/RimL family protein N-acetyltransferase
LKRVRLSPIDRDGSPRDFRGELPEVVQEILETTRSLYASEGFEEPWIGYLAHRRNKPVGTCGFKSPPVDDRVEIAYFTFPEFQGRGCASAMAAKLIAIAKRHQPGLTIAAQTLPAPSASTRILEKLGFRRVETLDHPEDGRVWEWQLSTR